MAVYYSTVLVVHSRQNKDKHANRPKWGYFSRNKVFKRDFGNRNQAEMTSGCPLFQARGTHTHSASARGTRTPSAWASATPTHSGWASATPTASD